MKQTKESAGLTRRGFIKTLGLGTLVGTAAAANAAAPVEGEAAPARAQAVPRRKLGKSGVEVSVLSLGGMFDTINNQLLLKQAHQWGVTYWDTAEGYGNGKSEEGFGRFFSRNPEIRKDIFLATKSRPAPPDLMTKALDNSLKRLNTEYVDLYFIHAVCNVSEVTDPLRQWGNRVKKAGKVKLFGFSTHTNMEDCLLGAAKLEGMDAIMFAYNFRLMQTEKMKEAVDACAAAGIGLVAMKTQGGGPVKTDSEAELQLAGRFLDRGFTDKQAKLKAVWENPHIACVCSQMPTLTILSANVAASRDLTTLSRDDLDLFRAFAADTRAGYCAGCGRICEAAAGGVVPVREVMRCLMYYREYTDPELARSVFASLPREARSLLARIDYSNAEKACPQGLAISRLMEEAARILV